MIVLDTLENKNGFITVFDDNGLITIQMSANGVSKIINVFDSYILSNKEHTDIIKVTESNEVFSIELNLKNEEGGFHLTGVRTDNGSYYHEFELEYCDIETWNKIKEFLNKN